MKSMAIRLKRRRLMPHNGAFEWRVLSGGPGIILSRMLSRFYITDICVRFHPRFWAMPANFVMLRMANIEF